MEKDTSGYGLKFIYPEIYSEWEGGNYDDRDKYRAEFETAGVKKMEKRLRKCESYIKENEPKWAAETIENPQRNRFQKVNEEELKQEQEKFLQKKRGIEDKIERSFKE